MILDHGNGREGGSGAYRKPRGYGVPHRGAVQAVVGCSSEVRGGLLNHPAMCVSSNVLGSMLLEVCGDRLDAIFLNDHAETNDAFTLIKANYLPLAPLMTDARVLSNGLFRFTLVGDPGPIYRIEASDDLTCWTEIGCITNLTGQVQFFDTMPPTNQQLYYRGRLEMPVKRLGPAQ